MDPCGRIRDGRAMIRGWEGKRAGRVALGVGAAVAVLFGVQSTARTRCSGAATLETAGPPASIPSSCVTTVAPPAAAGTPHCTPLTLVFVRYYMLCKLVFGSFAWLSLFKLTSMAVIYVGALYMLPISYMVHQHHFPFLSTTMTSGQLTLSLIFLLILATTAHWYVITSLPNLSN